MKDRVSLYPGRVKLTPVAGQADTYDLVRADSPTQEGTPLNKNTILKDTTAALYGLGDDAVPDEVFNELARLNSELGNEYVWDVTEPTQGVNIANTKTAYYLFGTTYNSAILQYSDSAIVSNGQVVLVNPTQITVNSSNWGSNYSVFLNKYVKKIQADGDFDIVFCESTTDFDYWLNAYAVYVGEETSHIKYVNSPDRDAYPPKKSDGKSYRFIGNIGDSLYRCGDTLSTARTDLDDRWVLCNGAYVKASDYPDVATLIPRHRRTVYPNSNVAQTNTVQAIYRDGKWVAAAGSGIARVCVGTLDGGWKFIGNGSNYAIDSKTMYLQSIDEHDGIYVMCGNYDNESYIYTATDPEGTWARQKLPDKCSLYTAKYLNGIWVAVGKVSGNYFIYTAIDPTGTWEKHEMNPSNNNTVMCDILYYNGVWIAVGSYGSYRAVFTATSLTGTWNVNTVESSNKDDLTCVVEHDGTIVACGNSSSSTQYIFISNDGGVTWRKELLPAPDYVTGATYCADKWVFLGHSSGQYYAYLAESSNLVDFTSTQMLSTESLTAKITSHDGVYVACGCKVNNYIGFISDNEEIRIPAISLNGVYTYIKAKE